MSTQNLAPTVPDLPALLEISIREPLPEDAVKHILSVPPFLPVPMALNLRTISSVRLAQGIVFRSGALSHLPPSSLSLLKSDYNINTIFDLRSQNERERSATPPIEGIENIWIPSTIDIDSGVDPAEDQGLALQHIKPTSFVANGGVDGFVAMYENVLETHRDAFQAIFQRLRDGKGGVLFHCTAGKDRTGVLAALIHALLESPEEAIARDYELSRIGVEPFRERLVQTLLQQLGRTGKVDEPGLVEMGGSRGPAILAFLNSLDDKYASAVNGKYSGAKGYMVQKLGMTAEDLEKIKMNLSAA